MTARLPRPAALAPLALATLVALAACGVDSPPVPPDDRDRPEPGVTLSGRVEVGVSGTTN